MNVAKNPESNSEYVDKETDYSTLEAAGTDTGNAHGMTRNTEWVGANLEVYKEIPGSFQL